MMDASGISPSRVVVAALAAVERVAAETLPEGYGYECSGLSYQEVRSGGQAPIVFILALLFGYLFLVAQCRSQLG